MGPKPRCLEVHHWLVCGADEAGGRAVDAFGFFAHLELFAAVRFNPDKASGLANHFQQLTVLKQWVALGVCDFNVCHGVSPVCVVDASILQRNFA